MCSKVKMASGHFVSTRDEGEKGRERERKKEQGRNVKYTS